MTERRILPISSITIEERADAEGNPQPVITGYAAVFYRADDPATVFRPFKGFEERVRPGAFARAIAEDDPIATFNHDMHAVPLGRLSADTLSLTEDDKGLRMEITPPDTEAGRSVVEAIRRQDVRGASFAFQALKEEFSTVEETDIRELIDVRLLDVAIVTRPAYDATSVAIRAEEGGAAEAQQRLEAYRQQKAELDGLLTRARTIEQGL